LALIGVIDARGVDSILAFVQRVRHTSSGCMKAPSGPPVGAGLDPKLSADEMATLAGTWDSELQIVEGKEVPITEMSKSNIVISGNSLVRYVFAADGRELTPVRPQTPSRSR
jgi:hypothetical protein